MQKSKILKERFGLDGRDPKTYDEIALESNISRERVRQIEAKALRKLKHPNRSKRLVDFVE